jgi:predicted dehydrogenase
MCADLSSDRLRVMKETFRNIHPTRDYKEILKHPKIDAVVIATPTASHYAVVKEALLAGKDVLCEKPLCKDIHQAKELVAIARRKRKILMVGHVFLYNPGIRKMRDYIKSKFCGQIYYMHSERTNLGPFRRDVNAAWDLASHDISIFNYLFNSQPLEVSARGSRYLQKNIEDVVFITLIYPKNILVNIHVSWLDPRKVRQITLVGSQKMVIWDDLNNEGPIKIYDRLVVRQYYETFGEFNLLAKEGNITIPKVDLFEPLKAQDAHFLECIQERRQPLSDGQSAVDVIEVLEATEKSLAKRGAPIRLK